MTAPRTTASPKARPAPRGPFSWPLLLGLLAALQLGLAPRAALAEDEAAGRRHWDRGQELYKQGRYLEAAREFETGYQVAPRSNFLLNIGHSYRRAQELRRAKSAYETFLKVDPASAHRTMVEDLIRTIDDALTAQAEPVPAPPRTSPPPIPAGAPAPAAPPPAPPPLALSPVPTVTETQSAPPPDSGSTSIFRSPWFWGVVGAVVVAGVAGTVYGLSRGPTCSADRCFREMRTP